ncbi:MAG: PD-(D/E)XK nuclease family protein [Bacteroidia bacterium]
MEPFLLKLAKEIHHQFPDDLKNVCIVLPNRRASLFLKKHLAEIYQKTIWSPVIFSIEDFIIKLSGYKSIDTLELLFQFYHVYKSIEKTEAKSFVEFSKWAPTLLNDFNEIDNYLADAEKLFTTVNQIRALEIWNLDKKEPSAIQLQFIAFWQKLFPYYKNLKEHLHSQNLAYQGMAGRYCAENLHHINSQLTYKKIFFAGFNALNKSEEKIIQFLMLHKKAELFWDADEYYMDNEIQEAGYFLRFYKQKWFDNKEQKFNWIENYWRKSEKTIEIIGTAKNINQVKAAGEILEKLESKNNYQDTAVVLADENLLMPLLNSIPDSVKNLNVTMGMPLKYIPFYNLVEQILEMHEHAIKHAKDNIKNYRFYHSDISKLLQNPLIASIWKEKEAGFLLQKLDTYIKRKNRVYITLKELESQCYNNEITFLNELNPILTNWENKPIVAIKAIKSLIALFKKNLANVNQPEKQKIEAEYLFLFNKIFNRLERYISLFDAIIDVATLRSLFNQILRNESMPFYGEPLTGLQIMGVLETRTIDFENVILISTNEGVLPSGKTINSLIPFDIKRAFGLPTYSEKDSIFAYHFYRLLQRAKKIFLIYNTDADDLGGGEKSRYISQLIQELPQHNNNIQIVEKIKTLDVPKIAAKEIIKPKNELVLQQLHQWIEKGVSPSALNTYINCPLDFYYKYVLKLREKEEDAVEETIEASSLGNYIHATLQEIFTPFLNKVVNETDLINAKKLVPEILKTNFLKDFTIEDISFGKNYITYTMAEKQILKFIEKEIDEIKNLKKDNKHITIIGLEKDFETELYFNCNRKTYKAKLAGRIDRIDKIGNTIRVIDYKTGKVEEKELIINNVDEIKLLGGEKSKALQLLTYAVLYQSQLKENENIEAGIISFRTINKPYYFLKINNDISITSENINQTQMLIAQILEEIFNSNIPFQHHSSAKYCNWCNT